MNILSNLKKDKKTRNKVLLTLLILFSLQIGYRIPLPGIDPTYVKALFSSILGNNSFISAMTGGSFSKLSLFALSITPYITASIIMQLLVVAIPKLEAISKDGAVGHKKIEKLTMILGGIVAVIESLIIAIPLGKGHLFVVDKWYMVAYATIVWTAGAVFLIWLGNWMTEHLIGNGISLMLLFNILSSLPSDMRRLYTSFAEGKSVGVYILFFTVLIVVVVAVFAYVVVLNDAEKRIKIISSHNIGGIMMDTGDNALPLKLNAGGVMPIIFSSTVMSIPVVIGNALKVDTASTMGRILMAFNQSSWFNPDNMLYTLGAIPFILLTYLFAHFYMAISFNPKDAADSLRKNGTTIPGIRPGKPTSEYLAKQSNSMIALGTSMLMLIALLPTAFCGFTKIGALSFGGTTILIIVSVILETASKLEAHSSKSNYKSFLRRKKNHA